MMIKLLLSLSLIFPVALAAQPVDSLKLLVETIECPKGWELEFEVDTTRAYFDRDYQCSKLTFVKDDFKVRYWIIKEVVNDFALLDSSMARYYMMASCRPSALFFPFSKDGYRFISQMCNRCDTYVGKNKPCMKLSKAMREWAHKDD